MQNSRDLLTDADRVAAANSALFGSVTEAMNVVTFGLNGQTDGTGGADHNTCDFTNGGDIEVCASFDNSARVSALFEAELSECSMGGNLCGINTGDVTLALVYGERQQECLGGFCNGAGMGAEGDARLRHQNRQYRAEDAS